MVLSAQYGHFFSTFLITSLYLLLRLNEPVHDISIMRMLKNCQWNFSIELFIFSDHMVDLSISKNSLDGKLCIVKHIDCL